MLASQKKGVELLEELSKHPFQYRIQSYAAGLSELTILAHRLEGETPHCYRITFQTTHYIQAPSSWNAANLRLASTTKWDDFAAVLGLSRLQKEQLLLFVATPADKPEIRIVCHTVFVSHEIPL